MYRLTNEDTNMDKTLLTETDLSNLTGIPVRTLRYWRFAGNEYAPRFLKLGASVYYRKSDIDNWINNSPAYLSSTEVKVKNAKSRKI